ncbi:MAG: hypothetical protein K8R88_01645 [Armatimonadetes bacterium]|nr:hypothetical protein [Armatimonadota bacterium]
MIFLRHLGCIFCRQQVKDLIDFDPSKVIFVSASPPKLVTQFKHELGSRHRYICDSEIVLYKAFGLGRGGFGQMLNLHTIKEAASAFAQGTRTAKPVSDPMLLGGAFILSSTGEVRWSHKAGDAADNVSSADLDAQLGT